MSDAQLQVNNLNAEFQTRRRQQNQEQANATTPAARDAIAKQVQELAAKHTADTSVIQSRIELTNGEIAALNKRSQELNNSKSKKQAEWENQEAGAAIRAVEEKARTLLTEVGEFEASVRDGVRIQKKLEIDFGSKATAFKEAEDFHKTQARRIFWVMIATVVIDCVVIVAMFVMVDWLAPDKLSPGITTTNMIASLERAILMGVGRIAILFFFCMDTQISRRFAQISRGAGCSVS